MATGYCAAHDPMLRAGIRYCPACGATAYPADAACLGDDLIIASFGPLCEHAPEPSVQLVTPSELESVLLRCRVCDEPAGREVDLCPGCRCTAVTWAGHRCRNPASGRGLCAVHVAQWQRRRSREAAR